jgi:hypothetical protein
MSHSQEETCYTCGAPATHGCDASGCENRMCDQHIFTHVSYDLLRSQLPEGWGDNKDSAYGASGPPLGAVQIFCAVHAGWAEAEDSR